jgi:hypothetical protein
MHSMQPPFGKPVLDRPPAEAHIYELVPRHDAVLACSELRDEQITWST